jgi:hypothetical protein
MTASLAVEGHLHQSWREVREAELPAPDGSRVTVRVHAR